jgi:hypothetical protein
MQLVPDTPEPVLATAVVMLHLLTSTGLRSGPIQSRSRHNWKNLPASTTRTECKPQFHPRRSLASLVHGGSKRLGSESASTQHWPVNSPEQPGRRPALSCFRSSTSCRCQLSNGPHRNRWCECWRETSCAAKGLVSTHF